MISARISIVSVVFLTLTLNWRPAAAAIVTYDFVATVTSQSNLGLSVGDSVTGSFSYNNAVPDFNSGNDDVGVYFQSQFMQFAAGTVSATVPFSFLEIDNYSPPALNPDRLTGGHGGGDPWSVFLSLADSDQTVFSNDDLPFVLPALNEFEERTIKFDLIEEQELVGSFTVDLTALTLREVVEVPEPSSLAVLGGMLFAAGLLATVLGALSRLRLAKP
jgi:hypothetical protein